jgi:putative ABC transport system ATP-binding protein
MPTAAPAVEARELTRVYRLGTTEVVGLNRASFTIASGALVVLKGPSGSGKSTLLALLAGLDRPSAGSLVVAGRDLAALDEAARTRYRRTSVGMVFQAFNLLPTMSVLENVCLPALLAGRPFAASAARARDLLAWLGLEGRRDHRPAQLSGGEMQRTAIARALVNDPALILADEPTGNLDSANGRVVVDLLHGLHREQGRTVVIATHSTLADGVATQSIGLRDGAITDDQCAL